MNLKKKQQEEDVESRLAFVKYFKAAEPGIQVRRFEVIKMSQ